jgi:hypothetical protein
MKRHERARREGVCWVFGCACIFAAAPSLAQWETVPDITLEAESNDNPALDSGLGATPGAVLPIDSASRLLADVTMRFRRSEPRGDLTFEPRVRRDVYSDDEAEQLESTDVFLRSSGQHRGQTVRIGYTSDIARERILGLEFLETLDPIGDDPSAIATSEVGANELRTRVGISPYVDMDLTGRGSIRLDARLVDVDYESGATAGIVAGRTDFLERQLGGEYRRELDQRRSLGIRAFASGYEAALNNNTTDTRGAELIYARELTELLSWTASVGTQRTDFALSSGGRRIRGTDNNAIFGIGLSKRGQVSNMRLDLNRRMSPDTLGFVAPRDELRVAWQRMLSARVNGRMVLRAIDAEGIPTVANSDRSYGRAELDVEWQFNPTWWFIAGYAHSTSRSAASVSSSDSNALTLGVRYRGRSQQPGADLAR